MSKKRGMNTIWHDDFGDFPCDRKRFWSKERAAVKRNIRAELQRQYFGTEQSHCSRFESTSIDSE
jgi:hypothetical protein